MRNTLIHHLLTLQEQLHVITLEGERQRKVLDGKRYLGRIVVEAEQIEFADDRLDAALQLTNALLIARVVLDDVRDDFLTDANLLEEIDLTQGRANQVVLRDGQLLLD